MVIKFAIFITASISFIFVSKRICCFTWASVARSARCMLSKFFSTPSTSSAVPLLTSAFAVIVLILKGFVQRKVEFYRVDIEILIEIKYWSCELMHYFLGLILPLYRMAHDRVICNLGHSISRYSTQCRRIGFYCTIHWHVILLVVTLLCLLLAGAALISFSPVHQVVHLQKTILDNS